MYGKSTKAGQRQQVKSKLATFENTETSSLTSFGEFLDENRVETMMSHLELDGSKTPSTSKKLYKDSPGLSSRKALSNLQTPLLNRLVSSSVRRSGILFAHDPELDSTPFIYKKTRQDTISISESNRDSAEVLTPSRRVSLRSKPVTTTTPVHAVVSSQPSTDDALFGIGDFREVFITEEDLERAKEKMESEKSNSDLSKELSDFLKSRQTKLESDNIDGWKECNLSYNHVEIGKGCCFINANEFWWKGTIHPLLNSYFETSTLSISIPFDNLKMLRAQEIDNHNVLYLSVDDRYLQLTLKDIEYVSAIIEKSKPLIPPNQSALSDKEILLLEASEWKCREMERIEVEYQRQIDQIELQFQPNSADDNQDENLNNDCKLCYDAGETIELMPCQHKVCGKCMEILKGMGKETCPWDRQPINEWKLLLTE